MGFSSPPAEGNCACDFRGRLGGLEYRCDTIKRSRTLNPLFHKKRGELLLFSICNPDRSPVEINRRDAAPTPTGFAQIAGDDFPVLETHILGALRLSSDHAFFVSSYFLSELHAFFATVDDERIVISQF